MRPQRMRPDAYGSALELVAINLPPPPPLPLTLTPLLQLDPLDYMPAQLVWIFKLLLVYCEGKTLLT